MLRQRELKLYQWMASYLPVLLIRLGIDEQTAFARKPDHQLAALQEKIRRYAATDIQWRKDP